MKTSVIFPARNEEKLIKEALLDVLVHLKKKKYTFEILVVSNGCTDNTEQIVKLLSKKYSQIKIIHSKPGYGYALRKGLELAKGDYVVIFNVDFYDLHLIDLIDIDLYGRDFVLGSKRAHWSEDYRPESRRLVSLLFNLYLTLFHQFKGSDTHGIKVMKKEVLKEIYSKCKTNSGIFDTELVLRAQYAGFKLADFPVEVFDKRTPRFTNRLLQTPADIMELSKVLKRTATDKELFYNSFADRWSVIMKSGLNKLETDKRINVVFNELLKEVPLKNKRFLEIGCGLGFFSEEALNRGAKVTGCDIGPNLVEFCRKKIPNANFVVSTGTKLPFRNNVFDVVLSTEVIEHIKDQNSALREMYRVTKEGGFLVMTTPNKIFKPLFDILSIIRFRPYLGNENWYYPWELKSLLLGKKVKIIKECYFNVILPNKYLDRFEKYSFSKYITINQGYLTKKR